MKSRLRRGFGSLFISFMLIVSMTTTAFAGSISDLNVERIGEGEEVTLEDMSVAITNDGEDVEEGGEIDTSKGMEMRVDFSIPDDRLDIKAGDYLMVVLPEYLDFDKLHSTEINMKVEGGVSVVLGNVTVKDNKATLTFTEAVENEDYIGRGGWFSAGLTFDSSKVETSEDKVVVNILGKDFTIIVKPEEVPEESGVISLAKTAKADISNEEILWTVTFTPDTAEKTYEGYVFEDILPTEVSLIEESLTAAPAELNKENLTIDVEKGTIKYLFDKDITGTQKITYKTTIKDMAKNNGKEMSITNNASLLKDTDVTKAAVTVKVKPQLLSKTGSYNVADHSVDWKITVNESGFTLKNAVVTDTLTAGLKLTSIKLGGKDLPKVELDKVEAAKKPFYTQKDQTIKVYLGDISKKAEILLNTKLGDQISSDVKNKVTLTWGNGSSIGGGSEGVEVTGEATTEIKTGFIAKEAGEYDIVNNIMPWKITVNQAKQVVDNAKVVEVFIYNKNEASNNTIKEISDIDKKKLEEYSDSGLSFNQKYIDGSAVTDGKVTVKEIGLSGDLMAQIVEISLGDLENETKTIKLNTKITDKNAYGLNGRGDKYTVKNKATLYYGQSNGKLEAKAEGKILRHILEKTLAGSVDGYFQGYNYTERTLVWKLHVNHNGIEIKNGIITDKMPKYFEIDGNDEIGASGNEFYEIYRGDKQGTVINANPTIKKGEKLTDKEVKALIKKIEVTENDDVQTIKFSFNTVDDRYIIFVKTKLSEENAAKLFDKNGEVSVRNDANMTGDSIIGSQGDYHSTNIKNNLISKIGMLETEKGDDGKPYNTGNTVWTIDVNSNSIALPADELNKVYVVDKLAKYLEPKMNDTDFAVRMWEMKTDEKGNLTKVKEVDQKIVQAGITYEDRVLRIKLPTTEGSYRIELVTRVTDDTVTAVKNSVSIEGIATTIVSKDENIKIEYADGGAWAKLAGKIIVTKKAEGTGEKLQGAAFELYELSEGAKPTETLKYKKVTDENGEVKFTRLPSGTYRLVEAAAPIGYEISEETASQIIEVNALGSESEKSVQLTVENKKLLRSVQLVKSDELENPLEGAEFTLYKGSVSEENVAAKAVSEVNGTVTFKNLEMGTYFIKETKVPTGYMEQTADTVIKAVVDKNGSVTYFTGENFATQIQGVPSMVNTAYKGNIVIVKTDMEGKPLRGAEFTLYDEDGTAIATAVSEGEEGKAVFENIRLGSYTIKETAAPSGYVAGDKTITITEKDFTANEAVMLYTVKNEKRSGGSTGGGGSNRPNNPSTDIPDEDVPLGDLPEEDIKLEDDVILEENSSTIIEDEDVPLGNLPATGGMGQEGFFGFGLGLIALGAGLKRRMRNNK